MANNPDTAQMAELREEMARLAGNRRTRRVDKPHRWYPDRVLIPDGFIETCFTVADAWRYIAEMLRDQGQSIEEIELDKPPGQKAYVMKVDLGEGESEIYIKVHFGNGRIIGRSFHYSDKETA